MKSERYLRCTLSGKHSVNSLIECAPTNHQNPSNSAYSSGYPLPSSISYLPSPAAAAASPTTIRPVGRIVTLSVTVFLALILLRGTMCYSYYDLPNDPNITMQWGIFQQDDDLAFTKEPHYGMGAMNAWRLRTSAASIIVAIIDSGIRYTHEDLKDNMWHNPSPTNEDIYGWNASANNGDPMDDSGHGTHCAGTIGAVGNNGIGISGVAWKVQLMACKLFDSHGNGTTDDAIACIDYARNHGARIINASWTQPEASQCLLDAITRARDEGIILVTASGNNSRNNDIFPIYPACYPLDNIITVTATARTGDLAYFSNYGPQSVLLTAPGMNIYSTYFTNDSSYITLSGTSMAAPYVTGALALLAAQFPNQSYSTLIAQLLATTDLDPKLSKKVKTGRLNLARALSSPFKP
ncbi:MAG TPA: S8 family peptidase [Chthoniobacterales bacterium]|nr:S8 family peptidase [Chthoniobacterales bacterium]